MITNEVQYHATKTHLMDRFDEAAANLKAKLTQDPPSRLIQLELDAVRAQADDLRGEIIEYEHLRSGAVSAFEAATPGVLSTFVTTNGICLLSSCSVGGHCPVPFAGRVGGPYRYRDGRSGADEGDGEVLHHVHCPRRDAGPRRR